MHTIELTTTQKDAIHQRVLKRIEKWYGHTGQNGMACLYLMHCGLVELSVFTKERCLPAAGTAHFQMQPDDGKLSHFSFVWNGDPNAEMRRQAALTGDQVSLPEMHCWIYLPDTKEVVDFSTGHVPALAKAMGFEWKATPPPPYIWAQPQSLWPRAIYLPNREATRLAIQTLVASHSKGTRQ